MAAVPDVQIVAASAALAEAGAQRFVSAAREAAAANGRFTVALSGGGTPRALYALLTQEPFAGQVDWATTHLFWSDERCVPPDDPESNYHMAREALLSHVPIPEGNVHRMRGEAASPPQAAQQYGDELRAVFGKQGLPRFDLLLLGLGEDGHTASLFPGVHVPNDPAILTAAVFVPKVNMWRLTLTLPVLNAAARVLFLVSGAAKAPVLKALVAGPRSLDLPSQRVIPTNGTLTILADRAAAAALNADR